MISIDSPLFQDPHIEYPIYDLDLPFGDYITLNKNIISHYRVDLHEHKERIINANIPFEFKPTPLPHKIKYGALLIHGLLDTPFIMKDIGTQLQSQGLLTRSILLPGHGTVPGSLLHVKYEDWLQAVRYGVTSLAKEVEHIILVGFSTGAILSIYHTLQDPTAIAGLIMLSPAIKINTLLDFATNWHHIISERWPRLRWLHMTEEIDYTKYRSLPFNGAYQVYRLTEAIQKINHTTQLPCPFYMALTYEDRIVSARASMAYFQHQMHKKNKMTLYKQTPTAMPDSRITLRCSQYPEDRIINFSHPSIPIAPNNPHYGMEGDYPLASRIKQEKNCVYCALDRPLETYYNVLYKLKLTPYQHRRLTFNPDFDFMIKEMTTFIDSLSA